MKKYFNLNNVILVINALIISAIFILNYFYQSNGFDFTLKCVCSSLFAILGLINLGYVFLKKEKNMKFYIAMATGLFLAMLGDVTINSNFILGAGLFALGHVCFVVAYCFLKRIRLLELIISGVLFVGASAFLLFSPILNFEESIFKIVCVIYALIISLMLGKAVSNFIYEKNIFYGLIACGSLLFFFSDLMLVLDWFAGLWSWTNEACMATYYPALCLLAFSMYYKVCEYKENDEMKIKMVLFDLDGTLLPMDQDVFIKTYFGAIAKRLAGRGYDPEKLVNSIMSGTMAMIKNDGQKTNEMVFWDKFAEIYGEDARNDEPYFAEFYIEDFDNVKNSCGFNPKAKEIVKEIKDLGLRVALATNPVFPAIATQKRIAWAGLMVTDFELYTTYENSSYCKPNLEYYKEIINKLGVKPEECLMIGNDVIDDMVVEALGMKVFLLTDCLINKNGKDISEYPNGSFDDLSKFIKNIVK